MIFPILTNLLYPNFKHFVPKSFTNDNKTTMNNTHNGNKITNAKILNMNCMYFIERLLHFTYYRYHFLAMMHNNQEPPHMSSFAYVLLVRIVQILPIILLI